MTDTVAGDLVADNPPVLLLGGAENAVACARRFVGCGIVTVVVNSDAAPALRCRRVIPIALGDPLTSEAIAGWLLAEGRRWTGAVLIPLSDIAMVALLDASDALLDANDALRELYRPVPCKPDVVRTMLDKRLTLELAAEAGVPAPAQWVVEGPITESVLAELEYPVIVKPRRGFELTRLTGAKYLRADDEGELLAKLPTASSLPSGFVINELIPGDDSHLSSYYALRTEEGETLIELTKRVDRRCPPGSGGATFHQLVDLPETAALGRKFFDSAGLVGLGNVEFKRDPRDGELKLIECNHRLTAATILMQDSGIDLVGAVYDQALGGRPQCPGAAARSGTLWYPVRDLISFRLSGDGVGPWLRRPWRSSSLPYWNRSDPRPSLFKWRSAGSAYVAKRLRRLGRS